jgi:hypothetical protein
MMIMQETLWKNNLNYVKDVPLIHVHFIIAVTVVPEKKKEAFLSYRTS